MPAKVPQHHWLTAWVGYLTCISVGVDEVAGLLPHPPVGGHVRGVAGGIPPLS